MTSRFVWRVASGRFSGLRRDSAGLDLDELAVGAAFSCNEFAVRAAFDDFAVFNSEDWSALRMVLKTVGDHKSGAAFHEAAQTLVNVKLAFCV